MITAEEIIRELGRELPSVPPETTIYDAVKMMVDRRIYGVLIREDDKFVGIWTERDLLSNMLLEGFNPKKEKVGDYMSSPVITAPHTDTVFKLLDKFLGHKVRHLLIEKNGEYIGLLYVRDVLRTGLTERTQQYKELYESLSLDFYEGWKIRKKHK